MNRFSTSSARHSSHERLPRARPRSGPLWLGVAVAALVAVPSAAPAHGATRFDPRELPVHFSGWPLYAALAETPTGLAGTSGGGISDYGSHAALKAALDDAEPLGLALYASFADVAARVADAHFTLTGRGSKRALGLRRRVRFHPWGWTERAAADGTVVLAHAATASTDAFVLEASARSREPGSLTLHVAEPDPAAPLETLQPGPVASASTWDARRARLTSRREYVPVFTSGPRRPVWVVWQLPHGARARVTARAATIPIGRARSARVLVALGRTRDEALSRLRHGVRALRRPRFWQRTRTDWSRFFRALPNLRVGTRARDRRTYLEANTALRMNLYAPRGAMPWWGSVPSKVHFPQFFGWDTAFHAVGMARWGAWSPAWTASRRFTLAEQQLLLELAAARSNRGSVCLYFTDDLECREPQWGQMPVQGWAAWEVFRADPDRERARRFAHAVDAPLATYYRRLWATHDPDHDGQLEAYGPAETWDDNPRPTGVDQPTSAIGMHVPDYEPLELQVWAALYADRLARFARVVGRPAAGWRAAAARVADATDAVHWDPVVRGWLDRVGGRLVDVRTPIMWWPAFAGTTRNAESARAALRAHLLNPHEFWTRAPVPSVALDSPVYDHAESGFYWQGQSWLVLAYGSLVALHRYGFNQDATELRHRWLTYVGGKGGLYETYDATSGEVGLGSAWSGGYQPAAFAYGWSAAFTIEALLAG